MEGTVLERDENSLKVEVEYGTVIVPMARVRLIEADTPEKIEQRAQKKKEAAELAKQMKDEGKVLYKGKWVPEEEKKADLEKIAEAKAKKKEAELAAKQKAEEAAAKAKADALMAAQQAATANNNNNGNGRSDRFSRRHNRQELSNDPFNGGSNNNQYNNNTYRNNNNNNSSVLNNNSYRGGR